MASQAERIIRFVSWNTNGLKTKLEVVLNKLNRIGTDVAFLQETHIGPNCCSELHYAGWEYCRTVYDSKEKGVAILISKKREKNNLFKYICHDEDYSGRYIVLFCHLNGKLFTLVNVYKNEDDKNVLDGLRDYLMETAEGVLVVGGDFNTVLHPIFDRKSSGKGLRHTTGRDNLEDFTVSLNLKDTWSYIHPTKEGYTWNGKKSSSRIDMFFLPEDMIGRVCEFKVENNTDERKKKNSDHRPLVLSLRVQQQTKLKYPCVASMLKEPFTMYSGRNVGKINGAEILSAIKSLTDSEDERPFASDVAFYKKHRCGWSEFLKLPYNRILLKRNVRENFKESIPLRDRHIFHIKYLIFSQIFAKRLSVYIIPSLRGKVKKVLRNIVTLTIDRSDMKIRWSFLEKSILSLGKINHAPPKPDCRILSRLLPKVQSQRHKNLEDLRCLQKGCPLTNTILTLVLRQLDLILTTEMKCTTTVCFHRQALLIHEYPNKEKTEDTINTFIAESGIKLLLKPHA